MKNRASDQVAENVVKQISLSENYPLGSIVYSVANHRDCSIEMVIDDENEPGHSSVYQNKEDKKCTYYLVYPPLSQKNDLIKHVITFNVLHELAHISLGHKSHPLDIGFGFRIDDLMEAKEANEWAIGILCGWERSLNQRSHNICNKETLKQIMDFLVKKNPENYHLEAMHGLLDKILGQSD